MTIPDPQTELDALLTADERRVTVDDHHYFRRCISTDSEGRDEIDRFVAELREIKPEGLNP